MNTSRPYTVSFYLFVAAVTCLGAVLAIAVPIFALGFVPEAFGTDDPQCEYVLAPNTSQTVATDYYFRNDLNEKQQAAYGKIEDALRTMAGSVHFDEPLTMLEATRAYNAVLSDNPDIFWVAQGRNKVGQGVDGVHMMRFEYCYEPDAVPGMAAAHEQEIRAFTETLAGSGSAVDQARAIARWAAGHAEYGESERSHTVAGVMDDGLAVCSGYSKAVKYACDVAGIPCLYVHGYVSGDVFSNHAWNEIRIDERVFCADVTWLKGGADEDEWFTSDVKSFERTRTPIFYDIMEEFEAAIAD